MGRKSRSGERSSWTYFGLAFLGVLTAGLVAAAMFRPAADPASASADEPVPTFTTPTAAVTLTPRDPLRVLFVGDSLTYGAFASDEAHSYRHLVEASLAAHSKIETTFVGGSGKTSVDVIAAVGAQPYDFVILEIGTNDATNLPEDAFPGNYENLVAKVRQASPDAALMCLGSWQTAWRVSQTNPDILKSCEAHGGVFRTLGDLWLNEANRGPDKRQTAFGVGDNFHPNDSGHAAIAERILTAITWG